MLANSVEPGLSDSDCLRMREQLLELAEAASLRRCCLVRVDTESSEYVVVCRGDGERGLTRLDAGADRDDAHHSCRACAFEERRGRFLARVEVRVRVGHDLA